jgi:ATP-dependent DNA helicase RecQ
VNGSRVVVIGTMSDVRIARDVFGIKALKAEQRECISLLQEGKDVVAIMRTGYGKSLCYQIPCVRLRGFAVIVSPLLALCMDQVQSMRAHGVNTIQFDSTVDYDKRRTQVIELQDRSRNVKAVYTTPETLSKCRMLQQS